MYVTGNTHIFWGRGSVGDIIKAKYLYQRFFTGLQGGNCFLWIEGLDLLLVTQYYVLEMNYCKVNLMSYGWII